MQKLMPKRLAATVPPLYATDGEDDPIARVRLFSLSGWVWLVTEYDVESGEAFGLVRGLEEEWGYFSSRRRRRPPRGGHGSVARWPLRCAASRGPTEPRTNLRCAPIGGGCR